MKDTVKKGILAGIGLVDLSIEAAKAAIDVLVKSGEMTAEQGKKAVDRLSARGGKETDELRRRIDERIAKAYVSANIASLTRLEAIEARIDKIDSLDRRVTELEQIVDGMINREAKT